MNKNPLLSLALLCSKIGSSVLCLALVLFIGFFTHWKMNANSYEGVQISAKAGTIALVEGSLRSADPTAEPHKRGLEQPLVSSRSATGKQVYLNDLTNFSTYLIFLQISLSILLAFLMVREGIKILTSVRASTAFTAGNVVSFRLLGWLCLAMTAVNSVRVLATAHYSFVSFSPSFSLLMGMVTSFILAEIFKEGQALFERDQLTI